MPELSTFSELLPEVRQQVDARLEAIWNDAEARHAGYGAAVSGPLRAARELCQRGGKRLRAALVAAGYLSGGAPRWEPALEVCCAVELLQAYFLVHDDWMDGDRVRRGGAAVHAQLEDSGMDLHRAAAGAVLAGDYTLALATEVLALAPKAEAVSDVLFKRYAEMQLDAVVGQKLDVLGDGEDPERVYRLKTGSYTVLGPLEMGLLLAGASVDGLQEFATPLGIAFQLRDDLIGAFASERVSGKPRGSDVRAGKQTLLLKLALDRATDAQRRCIGEALSVAAASSAQLDAALDAFEVCGARRAVEERIAELSKSAHAALAGLHLAPASRRLLASVVTVLVERES